MICGRSLLQEAQIEMPLENGTRFVDVLIEFSVTPYDPGCTYGPPEYCYPPEGGELDELEVTVSKAVDLIDGYEIPIESAEELLAIKKSLEGDQQELLHPAIDKRLESYEPDYGDD